MYDRFWQVFCDRLESEIRALGNGSCGMCNDDSGKEKIYASKPNAQTNQSLSVARSMKQIKTQINP
jgi:hypothetical protein